MKRIVVVLGAAVLALWVWHWYTRPAPPTPASRTAPKTAPKTASNYVHRIVCPLCNGLRVLLYDKGIRKDDCPLCVDASSGVPLGYRDVRVPSGYQICPNCQGMGLIVVDSSAHPPKTSTCVLCDGTGVIPAVPK